MMMNNPGPYASSIQLYSTSVLSFFFCFLKNME